MFGPVKRSNGHNGLELIVRCPVCGKKKLTVNATSGIYKCWHGCMSGNVSTLFKDVQLARSDAVASRGPVLPLSEMSKRDSPGKLTALSTLPDSHPAIQYLTSRGFDPVELEQVYQLCYCGEGKDYMDGVFSTTNTIIIPVFFGGKMVGWQSRLLYTPDKLSSEMCESLGFIKDEDGDWVRPPKYFTMYGLDKGRILYNHDWARQSNLVVVCEGVFDALAVGRCAVAAFGKSLTDTQVNLVKSNWDLAVLLLDPDANKESNQLDLRLTNSISLKLEGYKDAGEAPRMEIWRQIAAAIENNPEHKRYGKTLADYNFLV